MLDYNEIKPRKYIVVDGEPFEVIENHVARKSQGKPSNQTKIKSLISGKTVEKTFHVSDSVHEADIENKNIKYLYQKGQEVWFCAENDPKDRFMLGESVLEDKLKFLKANDVVKGMYFEDEVIGIKIPIKVTLVVKEAPPAVKGNTSSGATKRVTLENGLEIFTPLFINEGDKIVVNTEKEEYAERAKE